MANFKTFLVALMLIPFGVFAAEDDDSDDDAGGTQAPTCQGASPGDIDEAVRSATRTQRIVSRYNKAKSSGTNGHGNVHVKTNLDSAWTCYTWEAELILPSCWKLATAHSYTDVSTEAEVTALTATGSANWHVQRDFTRGGTGSHFCDDYWFDPQENVSIGHLKVGVRRNTSEGTAGPLEGNNGRHYFFPVEFHSVD